MDILGSLGTLVTNAKNITLPGVFAALAFALLIWPPRTYDRLPTVNDNHPDIATLRLAASQFKDDSNASLGEYLQQATPACTVKEGADSYQFLTIPSGLRDRAAIAVKNQLILDDIDRGLLKCVEEEQALQGIEDQVITNLNALIVTRIAERDGINTLYQKYVLSLSAMQNDFVGALEDKERDIAVLQAHVLNFQHIQKERVRRVTELNRLEGEMKARLGDAGRLRPAQKFDDILSGLSNHIVGFLTLVFAWGLLVDPINRAVFSFVYDNGFDDAWDGVRPARQSPGQDAFDKWSGEPKASPSNSNLLPSLLIVVICSVGTVLVIWLYNAAPPARMTGTIICASGGAAPGGQNFTVTATVIAPGSTDIPSGRVKFLDGRTILGTGFLDINGMTSYLVPSPSSGNGIVAKYEGSSDFLPSKSALVVQAAAERSQVTTSPNCAAIVPDWSNLPLPPFWPDLFKCLVITVLALVIAYFLPGVLKSLTPRPTTESEPLPSPEAVAAFKRSLAEEDLQMPLSTEQALAKDSAQKLAKAPTPPMTCEQKLAKDWKKLSQPQYAIGQGLMLRSDFETLQNSYYSQSLISIGLILPLLLLVFALTVAPQFGLRGTPLYLVLSLGEVLLLLTGVDRRHKYMTELDGLIAGAFLKTCAQSEKKPAADPTTKSVATQISDALKAAKILQKTDLTIIPGDPAAPPPTPTPVQTDSKQGSGVEGKESSSSDAPGTK